MTRQKQKISHTKAVFYFFTMLDKTLSSDWEEKKLFLFVCFVFFFQDEAKIEDKISERKTFKLVGEKMSLENRIFLKGNGTWLLMQLFLSAKKKQKNSR